MTAFDLSVVSEGVNISRMRITLVCSKLRVWIMGLDQLIALLEEARICAMYDWRGNHRGRSVEIAVF